MGNTSTRRWLVYRPGAICSLILSIGSVLASVAITPALAQGTRSTLPTNVPLPPPRPPNLDQPAPATEPQPPAARPETEVERPPLDRATLRYCATRWQAMKLDGTAAGRLWRDFAQDCAQQNRRDKR
ncbi:hypothetical protein SAMN05443249_0823 [Beijerinckia sp. 28-YEA-48]|nr:hypothetical protein SAMN05443249_0823 [Beijerinckia sp. 28-YEA-48]